MDVCEMLEGLALKEAQPALYSSSIMFDFDEVGEGSSTRRMDGWMGGYGRRLNQKQHR